jgi:hypothetical protein
MAPLRDMLRKPDYLTYGLHWCLYIDPRTGQPQIEEEVKNLARNYRADAYFYAMPSFDETMELIFRKCGCPLPHALTRPHEKSLPKRFYDSVVFGSSNTLTRGMHADLYDIMQRAGKPIDEDEYRVLEAELSWKWGAIARGDGRHDEAKNWFAKGMTLLRGLIDTGTGAPTDAFLKAGSPNSIVQAMRRYVGLLVAQAKLHESVALGTNDTSPLGDSGSTGDRERPIPPGNHLADAIERLNAAVAAVSIGESIIKRIDVKDAGRQGPSVVSLTPPIRRSLYYQGICAYGVLRRLRGKLDPVDWKVKDQWEAELKKHDDDGAHFAKLKADADYKPLSERDGN